MWRTKRSAVKGIGLCLLLLISGSTLCSCTLPASEKETYELIDDSMYLNVAALQNEEPAAATAQYYEVFRGDFEMKISRQRATLYYTNTYQICSEFDSGTMILDEYLVELGAFVEAGQMVARVHMVMDSTEIDEKQILLDRAKSRYEERKNTAPPEEVAELLDKYRNLQREIEELRTKASVTGIYSQYDGYVRRRSVLFAGYELTNGEVLYEISPLTEAYLQVDNSQAVFAYGMPVTVSTANNKSYEGVVISPSQMAVTPNIYRDTAYIIVDCDLRDLIQFRSVYVSCTAKKMENVLMIDKRAVTIEGNTAYITLQRDDGTRVKTGFIIGGENTDCYWIVSGLSEGMTAVVE